MTTTTIAPATLIQRPFDLALIAFFGLAIAYGLLISLPEALGFPVAPDSPWPPLRSLYDWAVAQEPGHLDPSPILLANAVFDGFIQAPALIVICFGLAKLRPWVIPLGLFYAGAAIVNTLGYFVQTFLGPHPPLDLSVYLPFNLPWLIAPALLAMRLWAGRL